MQELLNELRKIEVEGKFFNATTEVAKRLGLVKDPLLAAEIVQLVAILEDLNSKNYELRKQNSEEDDE